MMKNKATLKFKNFTARPRSFWIHPKLALAGAALCCARPVEAICLKISKADGKPIGVGRNFKSRNATGADFDASLDIRLNIDRDIIFNAYHDINSGRNRAVNFKISNANLKTNLAVLKQI